MNLLLLHRAEIRPDGLVELEGRRAAHLHQVLRVEIGQRLRVGVVHGERGWAEVRRAEGERVVLDVTLEQSPSPRPTVDLILAMPRPKALKRLLGWAAAMGVGQLAIVNAWRVDRSYLQSALLTDEGRALREALLLGCEQGGTTWLPEVAIYRRLMDCLAPLEVADTRQRLVAEPGAQGIERAVTFGAGARVLLAVGPEGGWIQRELDTFARLGFRAVSLGAGILRVETAVVAALAQIDLLARAGASSVQSAG